MHRPGKTDILSANLYAMDKVRSRGCKDKYLSFSLVGTDYSNENSTEYLDYGFGCNPGACTVLGHMYEMIECKNAECTDYDIVSE